ncbi:MAG: thiamine pyrophosphate-dependent enzyme [Flavobacteriales bacterium]|jgi:pyruvate/2-oxoglutarate/acetoin dehydrogenase E1 component/TPP-dependent pyruvate/acetoin dehydrogenase alpha subunit|nr:thiamine pyrophosphate-dependent enzyme [Flavobacteriales bacterium]
MGLETEENIKENSINKSTFINEVLADYKLACISREASLLGRKEVLTGKAKFGIFGDGKELAQIAMAKQFKNGDFRSGYYRDQTFMMAIDSLTVQQYFAGLYAHTNIDEEPSSAGRQMGGHFATRSLNNDGSWKNLMHQKNSSADISPTAGQMPRLLGLALASKIYKDNDSLSKLSNFSANGNEVAFGTIGDASTSEGIFWETINAAGVLEVPMAMSVWDDGYGISVPKKYQTTKGSISVLLSGLEKQENTNGYKIYNVNGWDYPSLVSTYHNAIKFCRKNHVPVLIHVEEITQPQGHSTSGSHERYKSKERLEWAKKYDCNLKFKEWILSNNNALNKPLASKNELADIENTAKTFVKDAAKKAWKAFNDDIKTEKEKSIQLLSNLALESENKNEINELATRIKTTIDPLRKDIYKAVKTALYLVRNENLPSKKNVLDFINKAAIDSHDRYSSLLYSENEKSAINIKEIKPEFKDSSLVDGRVILRENFREIFNKNPEVITFGEDTGHIGGVNQAMEGMQEEFGKKRVFDTGIREATILGQGIGMSLRGLRPIAEIQYLDYLLYCLQIMSDDLATVSYRTKGGQKAPLIIRTRGHRLEGVWHAGSPLGGIINLIRGIVVCVPRNMTKAAGFYNALLKSDDPGLVIECLNGYRSKENIPSNLGEFTTPIGIPEVVKNGTDITVVSYGSTFNICLNAAKQLEKMNVSCELIDVQTLLPFDINHIIVESLKKTNKIIFIDEDVSGGATAFMLNEVITKQKGYFHLDSEPVCLCAKDHRPAYGTDGDYFSKPNNEDIVEAIYSIMYEYNPSQYPSIFN